MKIIKDKYLNDESSKKSLKKVSDSIQIDLKLVEDSNHYKKSSIYGTVKDENLKTIENAVVNIFSNHMEPLMHVYTDKKGEYCFLNALSSGAYNVFAKAEGKNLKKGPSLLIDGYTDTKLDFILEEDKEFDFGVIEGKIITFITREYVSNAYVKLSKKTKDNSKKLFAVTTTNDHGEYSFFKVPKGDYILSVRALGYISIEAYTNISFKNQIVSMQLNMQRLCKNMYIN